MASAQVVETSVNTNNSPSQDYTTNPDDHSNHNIDSTGFKPFTVIQNKLFSKENQAIDHTHYIVKDEKHNSLGLFARTIETVLGEFGSTSYERRLGLGGLKTFLTALLIPFSALSP